MGKFGLELEPSKTKLVEFGRYAQEYAGKRGKEAPGNDPFSGLHPYCTRNQKGNFKVGYLAVREQMIGLDRFLRGHYAHYGIGGNIRTLQKVLRTVECYWRKMLSSRSRKDKASCGAFQRIKARCPL